MNQKCYLIDLDGTMYKGLELIEGAKVWLEWLQQNKIPFLFLTNNSARTPKQAAKHMERVGYKNIKPEYFYTSAMAASDTMIRRYPDKKRAFMIGEEGLKEALLNRGYELVERDADLVFIGLDRKGCYEQYSLAIREIVRGAILVGTNNDRILLSEQGANCGNGSIVAMMEYASGQEAIKIGKPHESIIEGALAYLNRKKEEVIIVGDNMETDILCGVHCGIETILVTTGVHSAKRAEAYSFKPNHIIEDLRELIR